MYISLKIIATTATRNEIILKEFSGQKVKIAKSYLYALMKYWEFNPDRSFRSSVKCHINEGETKQASKRTNEQTIAKISTI